jgi:hypothetical protein
LAHKHLWALLEEETNPLRRIERLLRELLIRLFPVPTRLTIHLSGENKMQTKTYPVGTLLRFGPATEFDTTVNPPAPFAYAKGSVVYTQTGGAGALVDNGDGTGSYANTVPEVIILSASDSVSNPNLLLSDQATITFAPVAEVPNQLNIVLP